MTTKKSLETKTSATGASTTGSAVRKRTVRTAAKPIHAQAAPGRRSKKTDAAHTHTETIPKAAPSPATAEQIAERAYFLWLERGCPVGSSEQDWFFAEQELRAQG
jgi:hypothetical protein